MDKNKTKEIREMLNQTSELLKNMPPPQNEEDEKILNDILKNLLELDEYVKNLRKNGTS